MGDANSENQLDLTSDPNDDLLAKQSPLRPPKSGGKKPPCVRSMRVYFVCCRVYVRLPVPEKVRTGELKPWRVHCVRCGRLAEISV